ncbi:MAG: hypothetical protein AB7I27_05015 [Bacteriovoracaceae bacterium]
MKKYLSTILLFSISLAALAGNDPLPQINPPKELVEIGGQFAEGTSTKLSEKDIALFIPWAQSAQTMLNDALKDIENMPLEEQVKHLQATIQNVVRSSGSKNYQMLMRFALNRTLLLLQELSKEADWHSSAIQANALDLAFKGIKTALQFYESDLDFQQRVALGSGTLNPEYAYFTQFFGPLMLDSIVSINDASAQMRLMYKTLEMVNWDLSRDDQAQDYSDTIVNIYNALNSMDEHPSKVDQENIKNVRKLIQVVQELDSLKSGKHNIKPDNKPNPIKTVFAIIHNSVDDEITDTKDEKTSTQNFKYYYEKTLLANDYSEAKEVAQAAVNNQIRFDVYYSTRYFLSPTGKNSHKDSMDIARAVQEKRVNFKVYKATRYNGMGPNNTHEEAMEIATAVKNKTVNYDVYAATLIYLTSTGPNLHKESMEIAKAVKDNEADFNIYAATRYGLTSSGINNHIESMDIAKAVKDGSADFNIYAATRYRLASGALNSHEESIEIALAVQAGEADFKLYKFARSGLGGSYTHEDSMKVARIK